MSGRVRKQVGLPGGRRSLSFSLAVEDGWPSVGLECLPFDTVPGGLKLLVPPLFVKKLSVGDVITVRARRERVSSWKHTQRSRHSTIWIAELGRGITRAIKRALKRLRELGCSTSTSKDLGVYAVDVPPGQTVTLVYTFDQPGTLLYGCHVPGHYAAGMRGTITVTAK